MRSPPRQLELSTDDQMEYRAAAARCLDGALDAYARHYERIPGDGWTFVRRLRQFSVYKRTANDESGGSSFTSRDPRTTVLCGVGLIPGTVAQAMDGVYSDTSESVRTAKALLGYNLLDGGLLHVSQRRSEQHPFRFEGIKWFAAKAAWGFAVHRDMLTFEQMDAITDGDGTEIGYHVMTSIHRAEWPANVIKGLRRQDTSTCILYRQFDVTHVQCFVWCKVYNLGSLASRLAEYVVAGTLLGVERSATISRAKRFSHLLASSRPDKWPPSYLCHVCYDRPFLSTHGACAGCYQSTCRSCLSRCKTYQLNPHTKRPVERRFCRLCVENVVFADSEPINLGVTVLQAFPIRVVAPPSPPRHHSQGYSEAMELLRVQSERLRPSQLPITRTSNGRPSSVELLNNSASLVLKQSMASKLLSSRSVHRRGGSCRFTNGPATTNSSHYYYRQPENLTEREELTRGVGAMPVADLLSSVSSIRSAETARKWSTTVEKGSLDGSGGFAPGLSTFEMRFDLSSQSMIDSDRWSIGPADLRSHHSPPRRSGDKQVFLSDLYSKSLSLSPSPRSWQPRKEMISRS